MIFFPLAITVFLSSSLHSLAFGPPIDVPRELAKAIREQEAAVNEAREKLDAIIAENRIVVRGEDAFFVNQPRLMVLDEETARKSSLERLIRGLERHEGEKRLMLAAAMDFPEDNVRRLYLEYFEASEELAELDDKQTPDHASRLERVGELKERLEAEVDALIQRLKVQVETIEARIGQLRVPVEETREEAIQRGLAAQEFVEAKKRHETDKALLEQMRTKLVEFLLEEKNR